MPILANLRTKTLYATAEVVNVYRTPRPVIEGNLLRTVRRGSIVGIATGTVSNPIRVNGKNEVYVKLSKGGWVRNSVITTSKPSSTTNSTASTPDVEKLLNQIANRDNDTYYQLLSVAESLDRVAKRGVNVQPMQAQLAQISNSFNQRQNFLQNLRGVSYVAHQVREGWKLIANKFAGLFRISAPFIILAPAVKWALVGLASGVIATLLARLISMNRQSEIDFKNAESLRKMASENPEIKREIETLVANNQSGMDLGKVSSNIVIGIGLLIAFQAFKTFKK